MANSDNTPSVRSTHWALSLVSPTAAGEMETEKGGGRERGNIGGEERGRRVEKCGEPVHITAVLELSETRVHTGQVHFNRYTQTPHFQLFLSK